MRYEARKRKIFCFGLCALLLALESPAEAQQREKKVPVIGVLTGSTPSFNLPRLNAFREGLHDLGYIEGKNITIEYRNAEGKLDRLPDLAAELVLLKVDLIVASGDPSVRA